MTPEKNKLIETQPLVDSGTGGIFMDQNYARKHRFNLTKLEYPITVIGMKNDIPWIIKIFIYYISNQNPILLTTGAVRIKSADYTC
jgi:hypothetical protein